MWKFAVHNEKMSKGNECSMNVQILSTSKGRFGNAIWATGICPKHTLSTGIIIINSIVTSLERKGYERK